MAASEVKRRTGQLGGLATVKRHGREHMQAIGKRGAATLWRRYGLKPCQLTRWALVDRETDEVKAVW